MIVHVKKLIGAVLFCVATVGTTLAQVVSVPGLALHFDPQGNITNCTLGAGSLPRAITGGSIVEGFTTAGTVVVNPTPNGGIEFIRAIRNARNEFCTLTDRFLPTMDSIRWELHVVSTNACWTTPLDLRLQYPVTGTTRFWAPWTYGDDWMDPLIVRPPGAGAWTYGGNRNSICIPVASVMEPDYDIGLSLVISPAQPLLQVVLSETAEGAMQFQHNLLRLGNGNDVTFTADIIAHEADWRGGLRWMTGKFPEFFDPPNPKADDIAGTGSYSHHTGPFTPAEAARFKKMSYRSNWSSSFYWPYFGMWLPPEPDAQTTWLTSGDSGLGKIPMSWNLMNQESLCFATNGFFMLNYFNVTEFGANLGTGSQIKTNLAPADQWQDATTFLYTHFPNAILRDLDGGSTASWEGSVVMDPGETNYQAYSVEQAQRHIQALPDSAGLVIDRMDWLQWVNYGSGADDGVGWYGSGRVGRFLSLGWVKLLDQIGPLMHSHGKVILANPSLLSLRLDLFRQVDGIYDEFGESGCGINGSSLIASRKPAIMWTWTTDISSAPDDFFQRHLYLGAYPTAPLPGNDHQIRPSPAIDQCYLDYGPLLDALRGKKWVLQPHCVATTTVGARVNLFEVPGGYVLPITFGGTATVATVTVQNVAGLAEQRCPVLYPGVTTPAWVVGVMSNGVMRLQVPLTRACALVTISNSPFPLRYKADNSQTLGQASSWINRAAPDTNCLLIWNSQVTNTASTGLGGDLSVAGFCVLNPSLPFTITPGNTLTLGGAGVDLSLATSDFTVNSSVILGETQEWVVARNRTLTIGGVLSGSCGLKKSGGGILKLTGANAFAGAITVSEGTLALSGSGSLAGTPFVRVDGGATFDVSTVNSPFTLGRDQTLLGSGGVAGYFAATRGASLAPGVSGVPGTLSFSNTLALAGATLILPLSVSAMTPGAGVNGLIQMSGGTLALSGTNLVVASALGAGTYTLIRGAGLIEGGATNFVLGGGAAGRQAAIFDTVSEPGSVLMTVSGARLIWRGTHGSSWDLTTTNWSNAGVPDNFWNLDSVQFDDTSGNGTVNVAASVSPGLITVSNNSLAYTISGAVFGGEGTLTKAGSGALTLRSVTALKGAVLVNGGTLNASAPNGPVGALTYASGITINPSGTINVTGGNALAGWSPSPTQTITINAGGRLNSAGEAAHLTPVVLNGGHLSAAASDPVWGSWLLDHGIATAGTGAISTMSGGNAMLSQPGGTIFNIGDGDTLNVSSALEHFTLIGASDTGVIKLGSGVLNLSGINTYTNVTMVSNGTLSVSGALLSASPVTVVHGTLGGNGTVGGTVTIQSGGALAPGTTGIGTLTTGAQTWKSGGKYICELNSTNNSGSDLVRVTGTLSVSATTDSPFTIALVSLTSGNAQGLMTNFDKHANYAWTNVIASSGLSNFVARNCILDTSSFKNDFSGGVFSVAPNGNALVVRYARAPLGPVWGRCGPWTSGSFPLAFSGTIGQTYAILTSTNVSLPLANWKTLITGTFGSGTVAYTDSTATNAPRFYRIVSP